MVEPDLLLRQTLGNRTDSRADYWTFADADRRSGAHAFFQYPAMMVPEVQGALLDSLKAAIPETKSIYDPFVGSGTMVVESITRGLAFRGTDLNPLAILVSTVKADPPSSRAVTAFLKRTSRATVACSEIDFPGVSKWFTAGVLRDLTRYRSQILAVRDLKVRRFLWICLAETVRLVSNSRTSTFKLHIYSEFDLASRNPDAVKTFELTLRMNLQRLREYWAVLRAAKTLGTADVELVSAQDDASPTVSDVLMTSPPYGDNKTTVPYGQYSYLALQFIDFKDIPGSPSRDLLSTTLLIDSMSLGGSIVGADLRRADLCDHAPALIPVIDALADEPPLRKKVLSFVGDYESALSASVKHVRPDGYCFWTLGERRVGGQVIPLVAITRQLLEYRGHAYVTTLQRTLPRGSKRMPVRNDRGETMMTETILVTRTPS